MIRVAPIGFLSWLTLPYPAPEEAVQAYTSRELESAAYTPLFSHLFEVPFARTALDEEWTSSVLSYLGNIEESSLPCPPVFVLGQPVSPLFCCQWSYVRSSGCLLALCTSDLRRLTRIVMGGRTVWRRNLICSNEARADQILVLNESQPRLLHREIEVLVAEYQTS